MFALKCHKITKLIVHNEKEFKSKKRLQFFPNTIKTLEESAKRKLSENREQTNI